MGASAMPKSIRERAAAEGGVPVRISRGLAADGLAERAGWHVWTKPDAIRWLHWIERTAYGRHRREPWPNGVRTAYQRLAAQLRARGVV